MLVHPLMQGYIAEAEDRITGFIRLVFNQDENRITIPSLHVIGDSKGKGIGTRLLEAAEEYAHKKGLHELWIGVMVKNRQALDFYRKVGFLFVREEPFTMGNTTVNHLIGYKKLGKIPSLNRIIHATLREGENLPKLCLELLSEQKKTWQILREGYDSLKKVRERDLSCRGFSIRLQYNPGRIKSSTALVDNKNAKGQKCFLCLDHLPENQKGICYRKNYLILCNPMPVFSSHFTISHLDHRLQAIAEHMDTFIQLTTDLGSGWVVLYNGPKCGASAPNHLHFQVVPSGRMPIEKEIRERKRLTRMTKIRGVLIYRVKNLGREVLLLEGDNPRIMGSVLKGYLNALKKTLILNEEPMINIAGFHEKRKWRLVIFPRRKHRPDVFFKDGDARVVVSPGVIDMGGLIITPVKKDFEQLEGAAVKEIYKEVSLERKMAENAINAIR